MHHRDPTRRAVGLPLGVLAAYRDDRYVSTDSITNVLRIYRKHLDLSSEERAVVERLSKDLFDTIDCDARTLLEHVAAVATETRRMR